jgi:hypothetical protein
VCLCKFSAIKLDLQFCYQTRIAVLHSTLARATSPGREVVLQNVIGMFSNVRWCFQMSVGVLQNVIGMFSNVIGVTL